MKTALLTTELLPTVGSGSNGPPALADVDGDGKLEVGTMSAVGPAYVFTSAGVSFFGRHPTGEDRTLDSDTLGAGSNSTDAPAFGALGAVALAELGGAGQGFQLLAPSAGLGKLIDEQLPARQFPADNHLTAWDVADASGAPSDGSLLPAYPRLVNDLQILAGPALADIDGDGLPEAIEPSGLYDLHAVDINGKEAAGWPKFTNGWIVQSAAVGDVDGDGKLEVIASTREGRLFAWKTAGDECGVIPWRRWHHDEWGSGNYHTDARPPASLRQGDVFASATSPFAIQLHLAHVPGNDLYCGQATFDVRLASTPIVDEASFAAAQVADINGPGPGQRGAGTITVSRGEMAYPYVALVAKDAAGNRSTLVSAGPVLPSEAPTLTSTAAPTATATAATPTPSAGTTVPLTATATVTCACTPTTTASATVSPSETIAPTASATAQPTSTATAGPTDPAPPATATLAMVTVTATPHRPMNSGCTVVPSANATAGWWLLLPGFLLVLRARRRESTQRRRDAEQ